MPSFSFAAAVIACLFATIALAEQLEERDNIKQAKMIAEEYGITIKMLYLERRMILAHGALMGFAFAIMFPLGMIMMRLFKTQKGIYFHAAWQFLAWLIMLGGFSLGVWLAYVQEEFLNSTRHPIIGIIVVGILFFMPLLGWGHHALFKLKEKRTFVTRLHVYVGRPTLILGAINGGLGIWQREMLPSWAIYVYSGIAGVIYLAYFVIFLVTETQRVLGKIEEKKQKSDSSSVSSGNSSHEGEHYDVASTGKQFYKEKLTV